MTVTAPPRPLRPSEPLDRQEVEALVEALIEEARQRARRRRRMYWAVAASVMLVGVTVFTIVDRTAYSQTASLGPFARSSIFRGAQGHVYVGVFQSTGKRGSLQIHLLFPDAGTRSWKVARGTGQYAQITGGGRISQVGGGARAWRSRLTGFLTRPDTGRQRVTILIKGRPDGVFELTPLQPGALRRDSGTQSSSWFG